MIGSGTPDSGDRLLRTVEMLWPDASVVAGRRPGHGRALVCVPHARAPKVLVPAGSPAASSRAMWRFSHALSGRERVSRSLASAGLRLGLERLLPDRLELHESGTSDSVEQRLAELLGHPVSVSVGVGSLRANQKPVLQVYDGRGRTVAFVKVGDTPRNVELVRGEAAALRRVATATWRAVLPPQLLHLDTWRGLELLVVSSLSTSPRPRVGAGNRPPADALLEVATAFDSGSYPVAGSSFVARLRNVLASGDPTEQSTTVTRLLDTVEDRLGHRVVRMGSWHGDFAPWNMAWQHRRLALWDWEQFGTDVPMGLDHVHYMLHTRARRDGWHRHVVDDALDRVAGAPLALPVGAAQGDELTVLYLCALLTRYVEGARHPGGELLHGAIAVLTDLLGARSARMGRVA